MNVLGGTMMATAIGLSAALSPGNHTTGHDTTQTAGPFPVADFAAFVAHRAAVDSFAGVVLVANGDSTLFAHAYGLADRERRLPNTLDTQFNLASMGKMFTAVAVLQLVQQGKVALDAPVGRYLPNFPNRAVASRVTVAQLLDHTSGLGTYFNTAYGAARPRLLTVADYVPLFAADTLRFAPGAHFFYSNAGYVVLGLIIERVSGQSYYDYIRDHVFKPAQMTHSGYYDPKGANPSVAIGYTNLGPAGPRPGPAQPDSDQREPRGGPAGGGYSTAGDLLRFSHALLGHVLLDPARTELATTAKVPFEGPGTAGHFYGFGFGIDSTGTERIVGHAGGFPGVSTSLIMFTHRPVTIVVLTNEDPPAEKAIRDQARELMLQV
jgi:CubicO group peptidase (beta-lactamase class C family)